MNNYIKYLENLKQADDAKMEDYLTSQEIDILKRWYMQYSENTTLDKLPEVLLYFYIHEDLDAYPRDEFFRASEYLSEKYKLKKNKMLALLDSFRKIIFEN